MSESADPDVAWQRILDALASRNMEALEKLLWPSGGTRGGEAKAMVNEANDRGSGARSVY